MGMFDFITNAWDTVSGVGGQVVDVIGNGSVTAWRDAQGVIHYAVDWTKTTVGQVAEWTQQAAGDAADFNIDTYKGARDWAVDSWPKILGLAMSSPPRLGPHNDAARLCMKAVLGAGMSSTIIDAWARDAVNRGYTLAINFGATLTAGGNGATYSGIYVDDQGKWGFFAAIGAGYSPLPSLDAAIGVELWMIFSDRTAFDKNYLMPGLTLNSPMPSGGTIKNGANALIGADFLFKGFRIQNSISLFRSEDPVSPDFGSVQANLAALRLASQAPSHDAAVRVAKNPGAEANIVTTALAAISVPQEQGQWRWCSRCSSLFWGGPGGPSVCPQGGAHSALGSSEYVLYHQARPTGVPGDFQDLWRWCRKCGGLHFIGTAISKCPADGGPHSTVGSSAYIVNLNASERAGFQAGWRWCSKCQVLWYGGAASGCSAGGAHSSQYSAIYVLKCR